MSVLVADFLYCTVFCTSGWFQMSVCGPENRAKEQTLICILFKYGCLLYYTNILPKELFWHYNDDDDNDNNLHHSKESGR